MPKTTPPTPNWQPELPDAQLRYYQNFLSVDRANHYYNTLLETIPWQQDDVKVFGKVYAQPRLTSLHSNSLSTYTYSGLTLQPHPMTEALLELLHQIQTVSHHDFNCVLLNLYRNGADSNGWHADNEKELGKHPQIASYSFGPLDFFTLNTENKVPKVQNGTHHGSLLLMEGAMQEHWRPDSQNQKPLQPELI